jgi:hypothetical protein
LYIDGNKIGSKTGNGLLAINNQPLIIGSGYITYHDGLIDNVMIFNRSLSDNEILNLYNNQK